jgi:hypothetical protein
VFEKTRDERRQAEMQRGATVVATVHLSRRFNPEHVEAHSEGAKARTPEQVEYAELMKARVPGR